jgi:alanyl aminopeptidase
MRLIANRFATGCGAFAVLSILALSMVFAPRPARSEEAPAAPQRLGTDVVPTFERIELTVDARKPDYSGSVRISLRVNRPTRLFRFHAEEMNLATVSLRGPGGPVDVAWEVGGRGTVTATTGAELARGAYTLAIEFTNDFDTRAAGLYRLETGGEAYTFTQFEADDARKAFPCWDEPSFKIPFEMILRVPPEHLAVANTPPARVARDGAWKTVAFRRTKPVPSYGLAIATGPLETVPIPGLPVPGRVVFTRGKAHLTGEAVRMTPPLLAALERYFGRPYPYEKLDLIAVPEFWPGGMENPGAITFREDALLHDPRSISADARRTLARYLAHEFAHMWFGDLVTMTWWDDLWLNESFAEWMGDKVADGVYPECRVGLGMLPQREVALRTDASLSTRAIRQPVTALDNLLQSADELAYYKGQAVLGMFERWLGPEAFRKGVVAYVNAHAHGNAEAADLWGALSKASGKDVAGALGSFTDQGGVPLVHATVLGDGRVGLSQRRFLNHGLTAPERAWRIPVTLRYSDGRGVREFSTLLEADTMTVALPGGRPAWLHPNADEVGYYRWDVEESMLETLAQNAPAFTVRERIGFIQNLGGLLDSGHLHGDDYLRLLRRFSSDPDPQVLTALARATDAIHASFVTPDLVPAFARYVRATLGPGLDRIGMSRRQGEDEAVSLARPGLLSRLGNYGGDARVLAYADSLARCYLADPVSIDGSIAGIALDLSATRGDAALFDRYRARFEAAETPADRSRFLGALGWFRDPALVERALDYVLSGPLRPQELFEIPQGIGQSIEHEGRPWLWIQANYERFTSRIPEMYTIYMPFFASGCSAARLEEAKAFFSDPKHSIPGSDVELLKVAQMVGNCTGLREREGAAVTKYLDEMKRGQGPGP